MPSVVASGIRNSPWACSPLTWSGPARPIGTWATPVKFSMLPRVDRRVERIAVDVFELLAGVVGDEPLAHLGHTLIVVVLLVVGNLDPLGSLLRNGVGDFEVEIAEGGGFELHHDLVVAGGERAEADHVQDDGLLERKGERARLRDRRSAQALVVAEVDFDSGVRNLFAVDRDARNTGHRGVAQSVLQRQPHALRGVGETAEGVQLLEDERGDLQEHSDSSGFTCARE